MGPRLARSWVVALLWLGAAAPAPGWCAGAPPPLPEVDLDQLDPAVAGKLERAMRHFEADRRSFDTATRAAAWGHLAMHFQAQQILLPARIGYEHAVELDPDEALWSHLLGLAYYELGQLELAQDSYARSLALAPDYLPARRRLGLVALDRDDTTTAEQAFRAVLAAEPEDATALGGLGTLALRAGRYEEAIAWLERALRADAAATQFHYRLAQAYRSAGNLEQAQQHLALRGTGTPRLTDRLVARMVMYEKSDAFFVEQYRELRAAGDLASARKTLELALEINRENHAARTLLAELLAEEDRWEEAREQVDTIVRYAPDAIVGWLNRGLVHDWLDSFEIARESYEQARFLDPGDQRPVVRLANACLRSGRFEEAAEALDSVTGPLTDNGTFHLWRGMSLLATGDCPAALAAFEQGLALAPSDLGLNVALARAYAVCPRNQKDRERVLVVSRRGLEASRDAVMAETLGMALAANGHFDEAVGLQEQLLSRGTTPSMERNLRHNLMNYRRKRLADQAWDPDDPVFRPAPMVEFLPWDLAAP